MEVGPFGTMAIGVDPTGTMFGLWQGGEHPGFQRYNEPGSVTWNEAAFDDPAAARKFYGSLFGYTYDEVPGVEAYTTFRTADREADYPLGGLGGAQPGAPKGWLVCFAVASTDEAVAAVESAGGKVTTPATDTPFGRFAVVEDPWGAAFEVMQSPSGS